MEPSWVILEPSSAISIQIPIMVKDKKAAFKNWLGLDRPKCYFMNGEKVKERDLPSWFKKGLSP
eukprot:4301439-Karenia_brevis.AAC.1